jgi:hypothetical protein
VKAIQAIAQTFDSLPPGNWIAKPGRAAKGKKGLLVEKKSTVPRGGDPTAWHDWRT